MLPISLPKLTSWVRRWAMPKRKPIRKTEAFRPRFETLEDRLAPATASFDFKGFLGTLGVS